MTDKLELPEEEWRQRLTAEQYHVTREAGTEQAFTGKYTDCKDDGTYSCICCGTKLFKSEHKFDSGSGWPSFVTPLAEDRVTTHPDHSGGRMRTEVRCAHCDAHLGHVFADGPAPTGQRYCINSVALDLQKVKKEQDTEA